MMSEAEQHLGLDSINLTTTALLFTLKEIKPLKHVFPTLAVLCARIYTSVTMMNRLSQSVRGTQCHTDLKKQQLREALGHCRHNIDIT